MTQIPQVQAVETTAPPSNRDIITNAHENQILAVSFDNGTQHYEGVCQVMQLIRKPGKGGETYAIVRFHGDNRMLRLGWRDETLKAVKVMELEDLESYFVSRERSRVRTENRKANQMNLQTGAETVSPPKVRAATKAGRKAKKAAATKPAPVYAQFPSPSEAFTASGADLPPPVAPPTHNH